MRANQVKLIPYSKKDSFTSPFPLYESGKNKSKKPILTQESVFRQIIRQLSPKSQRQRNDLKQSISNQYKKHLSMVQAHQKRMMKFMKEHEKSLKQLQQRNIQKKAQISYRQQKAAANKQYFIKKKSSQVQAQLSKWKNSVSLQKNYCEQLLNESTQKINQWSRKCSNSLMKKKQHMKQKSLLIKNHLDKVERLRDSRQSYSQSASERSFNNPQIYRKNRKDSVHSFRKNSSSSQRSLKHSIENSTRKKQIQEAELQKSLFNTVQKANRIKQARAIKGYLQVQRIKRARQKQDRVKQSHRQNINKMKIDKEEQNKQLEQKFKQNRAKMRDVSLPLISNQKNKQRLQKQQTAQQISLFKHNYNKMIIEKLRNMSLIQRNQRHR